MIYIYKFSFEIVCSAMKFYFFYLENYNFEEVTEDELVLTLSSIFESNVSFAGKDF